MIFSLALSTAFPALEESESFALSGPSQLIQVQTLVASSSDRNKSRHIPNLEISNA